MRLVGGMSRGVPLMVPKRGTRPTSDKVREALFSMINNFVEDAHCLDLFAGSGSLGLEALSRGAESCVFVDIGRESCTAIKKNLEKAKFQNGIIKNKELILICNIAASFLMLFLQILLMIFQIM